MVPQSVSLCALFCALLASSLTFETSAHSLLRAGNDGAGYGNDDRYDDDFEYDGQGYDSQDYDSQGYDSQEYESQGYENQGYDSLGYRSAIKEPAAWYSDGSTIAIRPAAGRPIPSRPTAARPIAARPIASRPIPARPTAARPIAARPVASRPVAARPTAEAPRAPASYEYEDSGEDWRYDDSEYNGSEDGYQVPLSPARHASPSNSAAHRAATPSHYIDESIKGESKLWGQTNTTLKQASKLSASRKEKF